VTDASCTKPGDRDDPLGAASPARPAESQAEDVAERDQAGERGERQVGVAAVEVEGEEERQEPHECPHRQDAE
jgi:hypothetical protein